MTMKRSAEIALTPDGENNVNHLRVPEYGVIGLHVATETKFSKCHLPDGAPMSKDWDKGSDNFHFVPEKETIKIAYELDDTCAVIEKAKLELFCRFRESPLWSLDLVKFGPDWLAHGKHVIEWDGRLPEQSAAEQAGEVSDQGLKHKLTAFPAKEIKDVFPDGYVTLEHTPYKLKLTISNAKINANNAVAWTYFQILIKSIELELGPEEIIPKISDAQLVRDKAVRKRIADDGGLPKEKDATPRKVFLLSNVFRTKLSDMENNTAFSQLEKAWGDGPIIPLIAKIRLADSTDAEVKLEVADKGSVALGNAKFLWDWEDVAEDVDGQQSAAKPKAFLKNAIDYYKNGTDAARAAKDHTYPKGDNCHVDRGGKRGPDAKTVFPKQDGYKPKDALDAGKFPFAVMPAGVKHGPTVRLWAAHSHGWTNGKLKGQTGVVFQPSRMAGDTYKVSVYLDSEKSKKDEFTFDDKAEPLKAAAPIKAASGIFQIWREVHIARYVHKDGLPAPLLPASLASVQAHFKRAYVNVENKMGPDNSYALSGHKKSGGRDPKYNDECKAVLAASGKYLYSDHLATDPSFDHASVGSMFKVRPYDEFIKKAYDSYFGTSATDMAGWGSNHFYNFGTATLGPGGWNFVDPLLTKLASFQTWLSGQGLERYGKYSKRLGDDIFSWSDSLLDKFELIKGAKTGVGEEAPDGVTTIEFDFTDTFIKYLVQGGHGYDWCWYGKVVDTSDTDEKHSLIVFWEREATSGADKFAHEFGHNMYLPHSKNDNGGLPGGTQESRHDQADGNCLMSYSSVRHGFCGLCQLRMRGWDADKLDKDSTKNKKP